MAGQRLSFQDAIYIKSAYLPYKDFIWMLRQIKTEKNRIELNKLHFCFQGKVCFDEVQLEQVCEYPSETSMLACSSYSHDQWKLQEDGVQQDEEAVVDGVSNSTLNAGISRGRGLRVGQCHPLLKKHNVWLT